MLGQIDLKTMLPFILLAAGGATLFLLRSRLRADAFDQSPQRRAGLGPMDIFIGLLIMMASMALLLPPVAVALGWPEKSEDFTIEQIAWRSFIGQILSMGPAIAYILFRANMTDGGVQALGLLPRKPWRELAAGGLGMLAAIPIVGAVSVIFTFIHALVTQKPSDPIAHDMLRRMMETTEPLAIGLMVASAVILAPIFEEIIFRGLVQTSLQEATNYSQRWLIVLASAGIFCAIHADVAQWQALPGLMALGIILGWLYERHGSLLPCVLLHMLFNIANIGLALLIRKEAAAGAG